MLRREVKARMLTYHYENLSKKESTTFLTNLKSNRGFSLFEILVALLLVVSVFTIVGIGSNSNRDNIDEILFLFERAVRFSNDESILRNKITRIKLDLDTDPQELSVEYGPNSDLIIPIDMLEAVKLDNLTGKEKEDYLAKTKKLDNEFHRVKEFQESSKKIENGIRIIAIGTTLNNSIITEGTAGIYVYPNGEKDGAMIVLSSYEEMASISFEPYNFDFQYKYYSFDREFLDEDERSEYIYNKAEEIIKEWQKK